MIGVSSAIISICSSRVKRFEITPVAYKYKLNYAVMINYKTVMLTDVHVPLPAFLNTTFTKLWGHAPFLESKWPGK